MAFGLVHSSVERSTSRHGHLHASAQLLYRLALVLVLGLIVSDGPMIDYNRKSVGLGLPIATTVRPTGWFDFFGACVIRGIAGKGL